MAAAAEKSPFQEWFIDYYCAMTANTSEQLCLKNIDQIEQTGAYKACAHLLQWLVPSTNGDGYDQKMCSDNDGKIVPSEEDKDALARHLISSTTYPTFQALDEYELPITEATAAFESAPYNSIARNAAHARRSVLFTKREAEMAPLREKYNAVFDPMWKKIALFQHTKGLRFARK